MKYVFDSDALIVLFNNFYRERFPSLWEKFDRLVENGTIISVREVYNEIEGNDDRLSQWAKEKKAIFQQPSPEELAVVAEIFKVTHFQSLIREKERIQENLLQTHL